jgi:hypothetical protein
MSEKKGWLWPSLFVGESSIRADVAALLKGLENPVPACNIPGREIISRTADGRSICVLCVE